jgi:protein TonB
MIPGNVQQAKLVEQTRPVYPPAAKQAGVSGLVLLSVAIGKDGRVRDIVVMSGDAVLAAAALDAVKRWVYQPTLLNGNPVEVATTVEVNFTLSGQ